MSEVLQSWAITVDNGAFTATVEQYEDDNGSIYWRYSLNSGSWNTIGDTFSFTEEYDLGQYDCKGGTGSGSSYSGECDYGAADTTTTWHANKNNMERKIA